MKKNITIFFLTILLLIALLVIVILLGQSSNNETLQNFSETSITWFKANVLKQDTDEIFTDYEKKVLSFKDKKVLKELDKIQDTALQLLKEENIEDNLPKLKGLFISLIDFVFYDGKIKGVTFQELSEIGQNKVLIIVNSIDSKIEEKFPNYKENISNSASEAFTKASEIIKIGAENIDNFAREKLGEDNYNAIIASKDEFIEYTKSVVEIIKGISSSTFDTTKETIKSWYEKYKNEN